MTTTAAEKAVLRSRFAGRWIDEWNPEDEGFWERTGARIASRNLSFSILSEHIGFSIWTMWSVLVLFMGPEYGVDAASKFFLVAVPTLVGAVLRLPYTFAVARVRRAQLDASSARPAADPDRPGRDRPPTRARRSGCSWWWPRSAGWAAGTSPPR